MPENDTYKPLSAEIREQKLREILKNGESLGTVKIPRIGDLDSKLKFYRIPLDYLIYNPHNGLQREPKPWKND